MKAVCDNRYSNQRPFKSLSIGAVLGILLIGLILLSVSTQAADTTNNFSVDQAPQIETTMPVGQQSPQ